MYEFFTLNALYIVLMITLTVWLGIALYLNAIEKKLTALEIKQKLSALDTTNHDL
ncbi:MAG: CcmD family protein [Ignavibacteria bacterium]|nr:CcmD family protein [Ignavibacteria bacterium]